MENQPITGSYRVNEEITLRDLLQLGQSMGRKWTRNLINAHRPDDTSRTLEPSIEQTVISSTVIQQPVTAPPTQSRRAAKDNWELDTPLFMLSPQDAYTIRQSVQGTLIFGATGAGKTSSVGALMAKSFLRNGYGGMALLSAIEEKEMWVKLAEETGRLDDLVIVEAGGPWRYNFLQVESSRESGGLTENLLALMTYISTAAQGHAPQNGGNEKFWQEKSNELLRACIGVLLLAGADITLENVRELIATSPRSPEQVKDKKWQYETFCGDMLWQAKQAAITARERHDFEMSYRFFTKEFAGLAERTRSSITAHVTGTIDPLMHGVAWELLSTDTTITPEATYKEGKIILINLPVQLFHETGKLVAHVFKYMMQRSIVHRDVTEYPRPVFIWGDEAHYWISETDPVFMAVARRNRCSVVYLTQNLSQFTAVMGHETTHSLIGNFTTRFFLAQSDHYTNQHAADLISQGFRTLYNYSTGRNDQQQAHMSAGGSEALHYRVLPAEFITLRTGGPPNGMKVDAYVFKSGTPFAATGEPFMKLTLDQRNT